MKQEIEVWFVGWSAFVHVCKFPVNIWKKKFCSYTFLIQNENCELDNEWQKYQGSRGHQRPLTRKASMVASLLIYRFHFTEYFHQNLLFFFILWTSFSRKVKKSHQIFNQFLESNTLVFRLMRSFSVNYIKNIRLKNVSKISRKSLNNITACDVLK